MKGFRVRDYVRDEPIIQCKDMSASEWFKAVQRFAGVEGEQ